MWHSKTGPARGGYSERASWLWALKGESWGWCPVPRREMRLSRSRVRRPAATGGKAPTRWSAARLTGVVVPLRPPRAGWPRRRDGAGPCGHPMRWYGRGPRSYGSRPDGCRKVNASTPAGTARANAEYGNARIGNTRVCHAPIGVASFQYSSIHSERSPASRLGHRYRIRR